MAHDVKVPRLAESISEAVLVQWLKEDGQPVVADEPIATLETDKAAVEIPADRSGVLRHARKVGDTVKVGEVIARIEEGAAAATDGKSRGPAPPSEPKPERATPPARAPEAVRTPRAPSVPARGAEPQGPDRPSTAPPAGASHRREPEVPAGKPVRGETLGPAVRRMVEELGLDPAQIEASGPGGRILKEDVQRHVESQGKTEDRARPSTAPAPDTSRSTRSPAQAQPPTAAPPRDQEWAQDEEERVVPMSRIRQRIAERLLQAQKSAAILTTFNEVDMSAVMELRGRFKEGFEARHGVKLSYMSFFARACVLALRQIPEINAEIRGTDIVYKRHVHLGIAVQTERGLVVPVVHHADRRSFADLEKEIARLAAAARENRLSLFELSGGTFTISNGGVFGSLLSTPILNPPQSGILGMHKIEKRPVVVDDAIVIRPMMYLALSYDHRIVDGEQAVTFLVSVKQRLEDPEQMLVDL